MQQLLQNTTFVAKWVRINLYIYQECTVLEKTNHQ